MNDKMVEAAMGIILHAGDARNYAVEAMQAELQGMRPEADAKLKEADDAIKQAHNAQTEVIQEECRGGGTEPTLLFIHAQDTVMTIVSEINMIRMMIRMNRGLTDKINHLEGMLNGDRN